MLGWGPDGASETSGSSSLRDSPGSWAPARHSTRKDQPARRGIARAPSANMGVAIHATRHRGHPVTSPGALESHCHPWMGWRHLKSHRCWSSGPAPAACPV